MNSKYDPINLFLRTYYDNCFGNEESTDKEEQTDNNLKEYKLENEIKQILYLLYQHHKIIRKMYDNLIKSL